MEWAGGFFDGRSARRQAVAVSVSVQGVHIRLEDGSWRTWALGAYRKQAAARGAPVRLERKGAEEESLVVEDLAFAAALEAEERKGESHGSRLPRHSAVVIGLLLVAAVAAGFVLWRTLPWIGERIARRIPISAEEKLGAAVALSFGSESRRCRDAELNALVEAAARRLQTAVPDTPYRFRIAVVDSDELNALAAPGGYIVLFRGLVERMQTPEELAAVLAHEMQHVTLRHPTRGILRSFALQVAVSLILGGGDWITDTAGLLGALHFVRSDEAAADRGALETLGKAGISPDAMAGAFGRLQEGDLAPGSLKYLSSHPPLTERIEEARRAMKVWSGSPRPIAPAADWVRIKKACGSR